MLLQTLALCADKDGCENLMVSGCGKYGLLG